MRCLFITLTICVMALNPITGNYVLVPPHVPNKHIIPYVDKVAKKNNIEADWLYRIVDEETDWSLIAPDGDSGKSYGLCQIQINTARAWGKIRGTDAQIARSLLRPKRNLEICGRVLKYLLKLYGGDKYKATMAYNAGTRHVDYVENIVRRN